MKLFTGCLLLILSTNVALAQYYYKDLVVTRQTTDRWKLFKDLRVKGVTLSSFESDNTPSEGFIGEQEVKADGSLITTHTHSKGSAESWLLAWYSPSGLPTKTVDTSDTYRSTSEYQYDPPGRLVSITNTSIETDNQVTATELHLWQYDAAHPDRPASMLKIRNGVDTTVVRLVTDEKGNIIEEHSTRNNSELPTVYYYYDSDNRLTDIVRYNPKARKLLPDYIFEYSSGEKLSSMLVVPEQGVSEYQKWLYRYNDKGLKAQETCYNKRNELMGRIGYEYSYR